jgi:hypothetical protein
MLRRKLGLRKDDLKELRAKLVPTLCTSHNHMAKAKLSTIKTTSQSKLLPLRRRRRKKEDEGCFMCGSPNHWAKKCPNRKGKEPQPE